MQAREPIRQFARLMPHADSLMPVRWHPHVMRKLARTRPRQMGKAKYTSIREIFDHFHDPERIHRCAKADQASRWPRRLQHPNDAGGMVTSNELVGAGKHFLPIDQRTRMEVVFPRRHELQHWPALSIKVTGNRVLNGSLLSWGATGETTSSVFS